MIEKNSKRDINARDALGATELFESVSSNSLRRVEALLRRRADPNIPENNGITPLMDAASGGHVAMVKLLLQHAADPTLKDNFGDTAATYARNNGFEKVATLIDDFLYERASKPKSRRRRS